MPGDYAVSGAQFYNQLSRVEVDMLDKAPAKVFGTAGNGAHSLYVAQAFPQKFYVSHILYSLKVAKSFCCKKAKVRAFCQMV